MAAPYHPPQRQTAVEILTDAGWVDGTLHVPSKSGLLEFLEHAREFVSMTQVRQASRIERIPFFALHAPSILLVLPGPEDAKASVARHDQRPRVEHELDCLLPTGHVFGTIELPRDVRLSDHLVHGSPWLVVQNARARMRDPWSGTIIERNGGTLLLNARRVVGAIEGAP